MNGTNNDTIQDSVLGPTSKATPEVTTWDCTCPAAKYGRGMCKHAKLVCEIVNEHADDMGWEKKTSISVKPALCNQLARQMPVGTK